jgi:hypothetical protein
MSADIGLREVCGALESVGIEYFVGGSLASSIHGLFRSTAGVDLAVAMSQQQVEPFCSRLEEFFYLDRQTIREALERNRSFNLIHFASSYKFDFFPLTPAAWHQSQLARRQWLLCPLPGVDDFLLPVCSAEDIILAKLQWFRAGGETSDRQWSDLRGVLEARGQNLDMEYLRRWAEVLGLGSLLSKLCA